MVQWKNKDVTHLFSQKKEIPSSFSKKKKKKKKKKNCVARAIWNEISFMDKALFPVFSLPSNDVLFDR